MSDNLPTSRRMTRSRSDHMLGGVCAGVAEYFHIDPTIVRLLTVVAGVVFFPFAPIGYAIAWAVMPEE